MFGANGADHLCLQQQHLATQVWCACTVWCGQAPTFFVQLQVCHLLHCGICTAAPATWVHALQSDSWYLSASNNAIQSAFAAIMLLPLYLALSQVPFPWFWKILTAHGLVNALTGIRHGLRPCWWAVVRYLPALLLALLVAARQQVQGRRHFCRVHGLQVT